MALKFLNKKGWHTGSIRNIENVWKAEQKHEAEQRKLEELKKQIAEERERDEFRQLQVQAGLTPVQDRLEFLYDSGLAVGKTSSEGFKELQSLPPSAVPAAPQPSSSASAAQSSSQNASAPGALFEDKPQSANDAWRKLHSDPLLMIRQREQEALARIKNNPVKMAMIRKSVETKKKSDDQSGGERKKSKSKHKKHSSSKHKLDKEDVSDEDTEMKRKAKNKGKRHMDSDEESKDRTRHRRHHADSLDSDDESRDRTRDRGHSHADYRSENRRHSSPEKRRPYRDEGRTRLDADEDSREKTNHHRHSRKDYVSEKGHGSPVKKRSDRYDGREQSSRDDENSRHEKYPSGSRIDKSASRAIENGDSHQASDPKNTATAPKQDIPKRRGRAPQLSEEERAAKLREMQLDAEIHEEQRWKRLKKADEDDAREANQAADSRGKSFLDSVQKSVYGAEKGGSATIEESVRRRSHFLQGRRDVDERNAFRR